jgi:polar amino acid transport system substrate-binding protein
MSTIRRRSGLILTLLVSAVLSGCGAGAAPSATSDPATDKLAQIQARGTLILPTDPAYPPSSFKVDGAVRAADTKCQVNQLTRTELDGYDVATGNLIADAIGVEPCYVVPTWAEMIAGHWGDRWDIAFASIGVTQERMPGLFFTQPYEGSPERFWVRKDSPAMHMSDLDGKRIGVCTGCFADLYLQKTLTIPGVKVDFQVDGATIVGYAVEASGMQDVADGKLDAFLSADTTGKAANDQGLALRGIEPAAYIGIPAGAIDKTSGRSVKSLYDLVNATLKARFADGTLKALSMKYFGEDYATPASAIDPADFKQDVR